MSLTPRNPAGPVPTLAELHNTTRWVWLYCGNYKCNRKRAATLAQLVIRWGPDESSDRLRRSIKCTACGHKGVLIYLPSWENTVTGFQSFPDE